MTYESPGGKKAASPSLAIRPAVRSAFIASPLYDVVFFILAPVVAVGFAEVVAAVPAALEPELFLGHVIRPAVFFVLVWSLAHSSAVFFRTHANPGIFRQHRIAFGLAPVVLFVALMKSDWAMAVALVLAPMWAVYHIGMQNFGLARIYDERCGNEPTVGRAADYWLYQVLNLGPFVAGASLLPTLQALGVFDRVGWEGPGMWLRSGMLAEAIPGDWVVLAASGYLVFYLLYYRRLVRQGYQISVQKTLLILTTGLVSVGAWGFLPAWKAFFVMNFFHGLQYFGLVWRTEQKNLGFITGLGKWAFGKPLLLAGFCTLTFLVGGFFQLYGRNYTALRWTASVALVISLLHYWYDGFVWSVRRREV